ncbi:TOP2 [Mytilus edulis]|uniref:TOP2 n=1 Tax=Mytilus edulis TaxID=6550 RepID=A0A8S3USF2_MYTED|nr:TOP2 [Mytilus edulis]
MTEEFELIPLKTKQVHTGDVHSTNNVNDRSRSFGSKCKLTEEFELIPLITKQVHSGTTYRDRIRTYANKMLMKFIKKLHLVIEKFNSPLEDWQGLYGAGYVKTSQNTNSTTYPSSTTCKGLDRLRSYPNQMLMKPIPVIKSKSTKLNLITETLSSHMEAWKRRSDTAWVTCPAQKDVTKMVQYAILFDKAYIQILVTNTRIHCARLLTTSQRGVQSYYESDHQNTSLIWLQRSGLATDAEIEHEENKPMAMTRDKKNVSDLIGYMHSNMTDPFNVADHP